ILKMMNRKYTFVHYEKLIKKIRKKNITNLHLTLSTDIITGFPGETKKDFLATKKAMEKIKFDMAYLAAYSPRPQTAAAKMKDNISKQEKEQRKNILNEVLKKTALENNKKMLGQETQVLVDKITDPTIAFGKTKNFKRIKIINKDKKINKKMLGNFVKVKITKANVWNLEGEII
ncbi:MAG TPA: TRAM domain-containing protein, partial [bacterium]|nr:TRAM domain-containing protein [bacterium]